MGKGTGMGKMKGSSEKGNGEEKTKGMGWK